MNRKIGPPRAELFKNNIADLGRRLDSIPPELRGDINSNPVPWIYTNDAGFSHIIPGIQDALLKQKSGNKPRIALLSGVGSFASIARLPKDIDAFVCVDITDAIFSPIQREVSSIAESSTRDVFHQHYNQAELIDTLAKHGADPTPYWDIEVTSFGKEHFLASEENYKATKKALQGKPFLFVQGNFVHRPFVDALGEALKDCDVPYASFTDLADWSPNFLDLLPSIPLTNETVVVWSQNKDQPKGLDVPTPLARFSVGVQNYISDARAVAESTNYQVAFIGKHD